MADMVGGDAPATLIAELLLALRAKGESETEIAGAVRALRTAMRRVDHPRPETLVDTCGTGGGAVTTVNLSTAAAFVAAAAGVSIAKHGNRSYTSRSGSADVLEALGITLDLAPDRAAQILADVGIVFLFAPNYHPAMRHVGPVRLELKVPTLMNLVGPLANPANARRQVVGIGDPARGPAMAGALARLGAVHGLVVHAEVGMDEFSPVGPTAVWEVHDGRVREWQFDPGGTSLATVSLSGLEGGTPEENAATMVQLLAAPSKAPPAPAIGGAPQRRSSDLCRGTRRSNVDGDRNGSNGTGIGRGRDAARQAARRESLTHASLKYFRITPTTIPWISTSRS